MSNYNERFIYGASDTFSPGATPQDVFTITGNGTTNVYVLKMGISTVQTTDEFNAWYISKRSTANSGGTVRTPPLVSFNSNFPASSSVVRSYTVTPTTDGTLVGDVWSGYLMSNDSTPGSDVAGFSGIEVDFQSMYGNPVALLSASQVLGWNFNGAALPGGLIVSAWIHWYETYKS